MTHLQAVAQQHRRRTIHWRGQDHYIQPACTCGWAGDRLHYSSTSDRLAREQHTSHVHAVAVAE